MNEKNIRAIKDFIISAEKSIKNAKRLLKEIMDEEGIKSDDLNIDMAGLNSYSEEDLKIVEGVFT
jgi:N-acetylglucosamine kinase-like BadF-type ATPase